MDDVSGAIWVCDVCDQENLADARFCEACGEGRGTKGHPLRKILKGPLDAIRSGVDRFQDMRKAARLQHPDSAAAGGPAPDKPTSDQPEEPVYEEARKRVRVRFLHLSERLKGAFSKESYREVLKDRSNPATTMLIAFVAWGIFRMVGFVPLMILLRALAFLMGPFGLVLTLAVAYVYSQHREEIDERVGTYRRRARAFARVTGEAARSIGLVRGLLKGAPEAPAPGTEVPGSAVRVTDEEDEEPPRPKQP